MSRTFRRYRVLSYDFTVTSEIPVLASWLDRLLAPFRDASDPAVPSAGLPSYRLTDDRDGPGGPLTRFVSILDGRVLTRVPSRAALLDHVLWHINWVSVEGVDDVLALHAGAVADGGRAILLPGPPESGKTTLVGALVQGGAGYLSDEAALVDMVTGRLHPYPRALTMDGGSVAALGIHPAVLPDFHDYPGLQYHVRPHDLRGRCLSGPVPVGLVVFPRFREGSPTRLDRVSRAAALCRMAENSFNFGRVGSAGLRALDHVVRTSACYALEYGDVQAAVASIGTALGLGAPFGGLGIRHPTGAERRLPPYPLPV
jgi:hypothetical protein